MKGFGGCALRLKGGGAKHWISIHRVSDARPPPELERSKALGADVRQQESRKTTNGEGAHMIVGRLLDIDGLNEIGLEPAL
jgi:hypothetical protein